MKKFLIVANWKSYKTVSESLSWIKDFPKKIDSEKSTIVICVPFTVLAPLHAYIQENLLPIELGSQLISPFEEGSYTGEINGKQLREFASYVLIGHSERRRYFFEDSKMFEKQVYQAKQYGLKSIFCATGSADAIPKEADILMYEPPTAISPAPAESAETVENEAKMMKTMYAGKPVLYGGNVTEENVHEFTSQPSIDGVVVGRASLSPQSFFSIIQHA